MKKPLKPTTKQIILDEYSKLTERLEKMYKIKIRYNIEKVQLLTKIKK